MPSSPLRKASRDASLYAFCKSAPLIPTLNFISLLLFMLPTVGFLSILSMKYPRASLSNIPIWICISMRPERKIAGSNFSFKFVAAMIKISELSPKPFISVKN